MRKLLLGFAGVLALLLGWPTGTLLATLLVTVVWLLASPTIVLQYPPPPPPQQKRAGRVAMAASFNPPHLAHLAMLQQLAAEFEGAVAIIAFNPNKTYPVSPETRKAILETMISEMGLKNVEVQIVEGYAWRWCANNNVRTLARGIRTLAKDGAPEKILEAQNVIGPLLLGPLKPPVATIYLLSGDSPGLVGISSTVLRKRLAKGESIADLLPPGTAKAAQMIADSGPWA